MEDERRRRSNRGSEKGQHLRSHGSLRAGGGEGTMVKNSTLTHPDNDPTVKDFKEHTVLKNNFFYQYLEKNLRNKAKNKI